MFGISNAAADNNDENESEQRFSNHIQGIISHEPTNLYTPEKAIPLVGAFGPYQIYLYLLIAFSTILWLQNTISTNDLGLRHSNFFCNDSIETAELADPCAVWEDCRYRVIYHTGFQTIADSVGNRCHQVHFSEYADILELVFSGLGVIIGGHLGDAFGRKPISCVCQCGLIVSGFGAMSARLIVGYTAARSVTSFIWGLQQVTTLSLAYEWTDNKHRMIATAAFQFHAAYMVVALMMYLFKGWTIATIIGNCVISFVLIGYILAFESPRWAIQKTKYAKAADILNLVGGDQWNHKLKTQVRSNQFVHRREQQKFHTFVDLFRARHLMKMTVMMMVAQLVLNLVQRAYFLNIGFIYGGAFEKTAILGTAILGVCRLLVSMLVVLLDYKIPKFGRRHLFLVSLSILIACYIALAIIEGVLKEDTGLKQILVAVFAVVGYCLAAGSFQMGQYLNIGEYYPTVARSIAFGVCFAVGYLGEIIMSIIILFVKHKVVPYAITVPFGIITFVMAFFMLVETKHRPIVDTFEEMTEE